MSNDINKPLSNEEIMELLTMTLHGPLPNKTMSRVFATLAEHKKLKERMQNKIQTVLKEDFKDDEYAAMDAYRDTLRHILLLTST